MVLNTKNVKQIKRKPKKVYLKLMAFLVKPVVLYAFECWGDSQIQFVFAKKFEQFSMPMCKQIPGVEKCITNDKVLVRAWRTSLKLDVETKMFKYVQRFPFS